MRPGRPWPLGATQCDGLTNIAVDAGSADAVEVCVFDEDGVERRIELTERTGSVRHGASADLPPGTRYGFRVHGNRTDVNVWNPAKLLVDPYARAIVGQVTHDQSLLDNDRDSAGSVPRSVVMPADDFDWEGDRRPEIAWADTLIYEAHVRGMTAMHPGVPADRRGSYLGMAAPAVVDHVRRLGVTAVELMPIHRFESEPHLFEAGLTNYWGYNTLGFFAPHGAYASDGDGVTAVTEFRTMVKLLHRAGLEVILDVVYNHTAEGGIGGPILSFRGLDAQSWYRIHDGDPPLDDDVTGCGNTLDVRSERTVALILDSLRYWVTEMHVDGFRFDLATALGREDHGFSPRARLLETIAQDPTLAGVKLIAEPWDIGPGGYQVGVFPPRWSEWNGRYRDGIRDVWRGQPQMLGEWAERMCGSSDLFDHSGRDPRASINFVTAHDGFTLSDLVSYEHKRNEANGEENRDGTDDNRSWNCGVEGPTDDAAILALRARQRRNLLTTLLVSQGVPMILAGDEVANSQAGSNNAYAQDNEISWIDWANADVELLSFVQQLTALRSAHPVLRRRRFLEGRPTGVDPRDDLAWFGADGTPMSPALWGTDPRSVTAVLNGSAIVEPGLDGQRVVDDSVMIIINSGPEPVNAVLPAGPWPSTWTVTIDTADPGSLALRDLSAGDVCRLTERSMMVLVASSD